MITRRDPDMKSNPAAVDDIAKLLINPKTNSIAPTRRKIVDVFSGLFFISCSLCLDNKKDSHCWLSTPKSKFPHCATAAHLQ